MIEQLEQDYQTFAKSSLTIGRSIANSVSMLQLDNVNESVAAAVLQIEALTNKSIPESNLSRLPFFGKFIAKAKESNEQETLRSGKMVDVVDRLFASLTQKKDNIVSVMTTLFELKVQLEEELTEMVKKEATALEISADSGISGLKARNLLVQVQQSIIKANDRVQIIDATVQSAEASTVAISSLLPSLQGELITEMALQAGLQELKEFKQIFDTTIEVVENLNTANNTSMKSVMLDVVDLAVSRPTDLVRLQKLNDDRTAFRNKLQDKMQAAKEEQLTSLTVLGDVRAGQLKLGTRFQE